MRRRDFLAATASTALSSAATPTRPNIVLILADDIGYGDLSCYGAHRVKTPNLDRLAAQGVRFTDAHSSAATCTPSRYSLFTGEYPWRKQGTGVLPGDAALVIDPQRPTLPKMLSAAGYNTAAVGKWHLGMGLGNPDWNTEIKPAAREVGFAYSFLIPATGDRVPCVYVENGRVAGLDPRDPIQVSYTTPFPDEPTGKDNPSLLKMKTTHGHDQTIVNGISRIGYMKGGASARWKDEDMADNITNKAVSFLEAQKPNNPFFLYYGTQDIHVPRAPHARFVGKTTMGPRGDSIASLDWCVGQLLDTLRRKGLERDTIVMFSSDNGPVIDDGYADEAVAKLGDHKPWGPLRGGKYSTYEAGTRVPFLLRWPARVKPQTSDALLCQMDLYASLASLTGQTLPQGAAPDSENILPALLGESKAGRTTLVEAAGGKAFREGNWKYIRANKGPKTNLTKNELGNNDAPQLFDLSKDLGEQTNLAATDPTRVQRMEAALARIEGLKP